MDFIIQERQVAVSVEIDITDEQKLYKALEFPKKHDFSQRVLLEYKYLPLIAD